MQSATFRRRLHFLKEKGYPILKLDEALGKLSRKELSPGSTVITIDDGFFGVHQHALGLLREFSFPATVYITTYYVEKGTPIFRLVVQYMFWKTDKEVVDLMSLGIRSIGKEDIRDAVKQEELGERLIEFGEGRCDEEQRCVLSARLGELLEVSYEEIRQKRIFTLMTPKAIQELSQAGIDIQLHTHRHQLPADEEVTKREIVQNREMLRPFQQGPLVHFCYPSGIWAKEHWEWLEKVDVKSATTCEPGMNYQDTPRFRLHRFLDGEHVTQIEFEAMVTGFIDIFQNLRLLGKRIVCGEWKRAWVGKEE